METSKFEQVVTKAISPCFYKKDSLKITVDRILAAHRREVVEARREELEQLRVDFKAAHRELARNIHIPDHQYQWDDNSLCFGRIDDRLAQLRGEQG